MGKTVLNQSDVEKLFDVLLGNGLDNDLATFEAQVQEVFRIRDDTADIPEKEQSLEEMCSQITDENRPELVDFGKPVGKEVI